MHACAIVFLTLAAISYAPQVRIDEHPEVFADVAVIGGTPAGVAAALAAARRGDRVTLVTLHPYLGGALTGAMMDQWDLNLLHGRSVEGGIFAEFEQRLGDVFAPAQVETVLGAMLAAAPNVRIVRAKRLDAVVGRPGRDGRRVDAVTVVDDRGDTVVVRGRAFVDGTDDGDVAAMAGARYGVGRQDTGIDMRMQAATLMFALEGVDWHRLAIENDRARFGPGGANERRVWGFIALMPAYRPSSPRVLIRDLNFGRERDGTVTVNAINVFAVDGRKPESVAAGRRIARREAPYLVEFLRAHVPGMANARIAGFAPELYVRETRHIAGLRTLRSDDIWASRIPSDAIGLASYPLDVHPVTPADPPTFATIRHVYGVPFGALVPRGFANLAVAGPAISATHLASGSARIIPTTIEEGEAAGAAAALALARGVDFPTIEEADMPLLQQDLRRYGVVLELSGNGVGDGGAGAGSTRTRSRETIVKPAAERSTT